MELRVKPKGWQYRAFCRVVFTAGLVMSMAQFAGELGTPWGMVGGAMLGWGVIGGWE